MANVKLTPAGVTGMQQARAGGRAAGKLNILIVSSDTYPAKRVDVAVLFGEELAGRGHRFDWILQSEQPCLNAYQVSWAEGRVFVGATDLGDSLFSRIRKHVRAILHEFSLFRLLRTGRYDIIEVKDKFISGVLAVIAARLYRRKFVFWLSYPMAEEYLVKVRDGSARYPILYAIRGAASWLLLYRILLPAAAHVFVQSEQMRRDLAARGVAVEKMTVVPMGIKPGRFLIQGRVGMRRLIPPDERCFLYLGTLNAVRHLDFLVRVLAIVRLRVPDAKLYFVGSGDHPDDERILRREAARLGVSDAMVFTGQLAQAEALCYVSEADVCVSPFYPTPILNSASPTKLVEYMAMSKPVVANDHPEQRFVIEQSHGGYCVPWEETAFAEAIVRLLTAPQEAAMMGERGRRYVLEHRSYDKIADLVESTFLRVLEQK